MRDSNFTIGFEGRLTAEWMVRALALAAVATGCSISLLFDGGGCNKESLVVLTRVFIFLKAKKKFLEREGALADKTATARAYPVRTNNYRDFCVCTNRFSLVSCVCLMMKKK